MSGIAKTAGVSLSELRDANPYIMKKKKYKEYDKDSAADRLRKGVANRMQAAEDIYTGRRQRPETGSC